MMVTDITFGTEHAVALEAAYAFLHEIVARKTQSELIAPPAANIALAPEDSSEEEWGETA
jgi:hypothetical protein